MTSGELTTQDIEHLAKEFGADPHHRLLQNVLTRNQIDDVAMDRSLAVAAARTMSHQLDDWKATNQEKSGRCWLFAGLNLLRVGAATTMDVKDFEFSQNHLLFWDKLEKANFWLEGIIESADREVDDRTVAHLFTDPTGDGGQWNMFTALVRKYGLVPQSAMPETTASSSTQQMNRDISAVLRQSARDLRARASSGEDAGQLREGKLTTLQTIYRVLALHLGTPPETVHWQWADKDKGFHRDEEMTPQEFASRYVSLPLEDYVCLVDDPRPEHRKGSTLTVEHLGNVVDGDPVLYLNVDIATAKKAAMESIVDGEPVWFGCDVSQQMHRGDGVWDAALYDYAGVYGTELAMDKETRVRHHDSLMTHAMLLTGVDVLDGRSRRWRVENSWGTTGGVEGYYTMNDSWFDEYVFEVVVNKSRLTPQLRAALEHDPVVLPAWDPMGALARS